MNESYIFKSMPYFIKILAVIMGGIIALILSGDIDTNGRIKITLGVILKFTSSVFMGFYIGEFVIDYLDWENMKHFAQGGILMLCSVFGMLVMGILYQSLQLMQGKPLLEVISEIKQAFLAIFK